MLNKFFLCSLGFLIISAVVPSRAETFAGNCSTNAVAFRISDERLSTTSTTPKPIPGVAVNFVQGGTSPDCVVVQFSSLANTTTTNASFIYFNLDGLETNQLYANKLNVAQTGVYTVVFAFNDVAPGSHTLRMRLASSDGTGVSVDLTRTLAYYRK
jgi:hypothetical protein